MTPRRIGGPDGEPGGEQEGRIEIPSGLGEEEETAVIRALEQFFARMEARVPAWTLGGRAENLRLGALHTRHRRPWGWRISARTSFARPFVPPLQGRGDAK